ncbi:MAG TPA: phage regulatory CII family protein [Allosphingosinicella sp.]|jgi:hypothetical protein
MSDRTLILAPELQAGKAATKALIRAFGGQEAAASECEKSQSRMCDYGSPHTRDFMPVNDVRTLEARTHGQPGHPHVPRWLARQAGHVLVRLPVAGGVVADVHAEIGAISRDAGEVVQRVCEGLRDGRVSAGDVRRLRIREEIAEAQQHLAALDALAAQIEAEGD